MDIVRGIAVLWMVFFETLDFFAKDYNFYYDTPWIPIVNWQPMFAFVSGLSVWLMLKNRISGGFSKRQIFIHGIKRYGGYIIASFFISLWVYDLTTFLMMNEILTAIGIYALVTLICLSVLYSREWVFIPLAVGIYTLSYVFSSPAQFYPFYNMLPCFFLGSVFAPLLFFEKEKFQMLFLLSTMLLSGILILFAFSDYSRFLVSNFALISSMLIFFERVHNRIFELFSFLGRKAFLFYVSRYVILEIAILTGVNEALPMLESIVITSFGVLIIGLVLHIYNRKKKRLIGFLDRAYRSLRAREI